MVYNSYAMLLVEIYMSIWRHENFDEKGIKSLTYVLIIPHLFFLLLTFFSIC